MSSLIHIVAVLAACLYFAAACSCFRSMGQGISRFSNGLFRIGAVLHLLSLIAIMFSQGGFKGFALFTSASALLVAGLFLVFERSYRIENLGAFVIPLVFGFFLFSGLVLHSSLSQSELTETGGPVLALHIAFMLVAISVFTLAAALATAVIIKETQLRNRTWYKLSSKIPSIVKLERMGKAFSYLGCSSLLAGIASGFYLSSGRVSIYGSADPLLLASVTVLSIYLLVLVASRMTGLRGRKAAWLSMCGYALMIVTLAGANFIENLHVYR